MNFDVLALQKIVILAEGPGDYRLESFKGHVLITSPLPKLGVPPRRGEGAIPKRPKNKRSQNEILYGGTS